MILAQSTEVAERDAFRESRWRLRNGTRLVDYRTDSKGPYTVGQKLPNAWGLYDMYGNVFERTADPHHRGYRGAPGDGSVWKEGGETSMTWLRGGSWQKGDTLYCRSASRTWATSVNMHSNEIGFRVVIEIPLEK